MSIEWNTVLFNIINFLILVWLLKKYLYKPITKAMDDREKAIQTRLKDADIREKEAEKEAENYRNKTRDLEKIEEKLFQKAQIEADEEKEKLLKKAQDDIKEKQNQWEEQMQAERLALHHTVRDLTAKTLVHAVQNALSEMSEENLEERLADVFSRKIKTLDKDDLEKLKKNQVSGKSIEIISSFDLPAKTKEAFEKSLSDILGKTVSKPAYKTDTNMLTGIELRVGTQSIGWGFEYYINNFEKELNKALADLSSLPQD